MRQDQTLRPALQQVFTFARNDLWERLPAEAREECQRLITRQIRQCLRYDHQQEIPDEREDST
jgi:hypothetical protein